MDKATAEQVQAEIAAATPEQQVNLKWVVDAIDARIIDSKKLDNFLADVVKEKGEKKRAVIAAEIKGMMAGLLGEDCSSLVV